MHLREQSAGDILRGCFSIYRGHFRKLAQCIFLLMFPASWLYFYVFSPAYLERDPTGLRIGLTFGAIPLYFFALILSTAVVTVMVSEICLGIEPNLGRALKRVFGRVLGKIIWTNLLVGLWVLIGCAAVCIGAVVAYVWLLFSTTIVVLEGKSGAKALKRSQELGKGYYWRIFGIQFLLWLLAYLIGTVFGLAVSAVLPGLAGALISALSGTLAMPLGIIAIVLMYYDLRVRKEAYDVGALTEDLR